MDRDRLQRLLRQHVETDRLLGVDAVPRGAAAVSVEAEAGPVEEGPGAPAASGGPRAPARRGGVDTAEPMAASMFDQREARSLPRLTKAQKSERLAALDADHVKGCTKCPLCESRTQTVFGEGNPNAALMLIGEGPGSEEDQQGRPFVGRAGQLLDKQIVAMGLKRADVFIANVVKCRPPGNRNPQPDEAGACMPYLEEQVDTIQPKVIVALGATAAKYLLGDHRLAITRIRGQWRQYRGVDLMPTFHPAFLLRSYTRENREKVWSDLRQVMTKLGLEVPGGD
jgi:DNA polymerase